MDKVVFEAPVLVFNHQLQNNENWQLRYCKLRRNGQLHIIDGGRLSFCINLKHLSEQEILAGSSAIRRSNAICSGKKAFPRDELYDVEHSLISYTDWAVVLLADAARRNKTTTATNDVSKNSNKACCYYSLAFIKYSDFVGFLKTLKHLQLYRAPIDELVLCAADHSGNEFVTLRPDAILAWMKVTWKRALGYGGRSVLPAPSTATPAGAATTSRK